MRTFLLKPRFFAPFLLAFAGAALPACDGDQSTSSSSGETTTSTSTAPEQFGPLGDRPDLPVDERVSLDHLSTPVDVVRDTFGRPHIYAGSVADAMRVEGYLVAKDRTLQLEILRRLAEGRMAEILGQIQPSLVDTDISFRHIGLHRVAKKQYDSLPDGEIKTALDAFADGITQAYHQIQSGELKLPKSIFGIEKKAFTDWTGADTLAIGRLQTYLLSYDGDGDVSATQIFDLARMTFNAGAADPLVAKRAGFERDMLRFAPSASATTTTGYPMGGAPAAPPPKRGAAHARSRALPPLSPKGSQSAIAKRLARLAAAKGYLAAVHSVRDMLADEGFGSNNWGVMPNKSATGHTLIASDPHLNLTAPAIFWPVSIEVKTDTESLKVGGVAFPGIPGIILGHNENIAWGATVAGYDVTDAYSEELSPDGKSVKFQGKDVPLEVIEEPIILQGKESTPYIYKVQVVPHHGPILPTITQDHQVLDPDPGTGAISIKWTGLEATDEIEAVFGLLKAKNVDEAYKSMQSFGVGAQNWMIGDTSGNLLWTSHARVPVRDPKAFAWDAAQYSGTLPSFVLPGDGTAEWTGFLQDDLVPWVKNPATGYISTANNDPIGDTLDNDPSNDALPDGTPMYLASQFDIGFREERIHQRIESHSGLFKLDDLASIQADHHSPMGAHLAPRLIQSIDRAEEERKAAGTHPDLTAIVKDAAYDPARVAAARALLDAWGKSADHDASSGVDPATNMPLAKETPEAQAAQAALLFNVWLVRVVRRTFGDEEGKMGYLALDREAEAKAFLRMVEEDPAQLATYDAATGDSAIWDDLGTPEIESRDERMIRALLDAFAWVDAQKAPLEDLRWGAYHTIRFDALIPLYGDMSIPPTNDKTFVSGFPRPGDSFCVDASDFTYAIDPQSAPDFTYNHGPSQRFVIDLDPAGPKAFNALPGGAIWDNTSSHFDDEAQKWRRNENHPVPFALDDVIAAKESRVVVTLP